MTTDNPTRRDFLSQSALASLAFLLSASPRNSLAVEPPSEMRKYEQEADPQKIIGQKAIPLFQHNVNPATQEYDKYVGPQDYVGKVVFLNFWASWCGPCRSELPVFSSFQDAHSQDVAILALEVSETSNWRDVDLRRLSFPVLEKKGKPPFDFSICTPSSCTTYWKSREYDNLGPLVAEYLYGLPNAIPTTFVIDRQQVVREFVVGGLHQRNLEQLLEKYK